jgi:hypothetical protein
MDEEVFGEEGRKKGICDLDIIVEDCGLVEEERMRKLDMSK